MQFIFIIFGFHILYLNSKATTCEIQQMQPIISCHLTIQDCFILEGDEEDYYKLKHIDKEIIQKSFTIPYKNMPILIKIFQQLEYNMIQKKLICQLFLNYKYYITCMIIDILNYDENNDLLESIKIETNILLDEICDEMYQLDDGKIILFCLKQSILKQYSVNIDGNVILLLEYDVSDQIQDKCKQKYFIKNGKNHVIIAFFQCSQWKILKIINQEIYIILESKMQDNHPILKQFQKVNDIQFCQLISQILYIVEGYNYLQINFNNIGVTYQLLKSEYLIQKIILLKMCSSYMLIIYSNDNNLQTYQKMQNDIVLNYTIDSDNIHFYSNYIFLQNQTQLIIRIDQHLIQTYKILNTSLIFIEQYNLFYQIDKDFIQFYRYFPISGSIQPKLQYIYIIMKLDAIEDNKSLNKCIKIQYENNFNEKKELLEYVLIQKNCQLKQEISLIVQSILSYTQQYFSFYNNNNDVIHLSIWNEVKDEIKCYQKLKYYQFNNNKTQLRSIQQFNYLIFQNENSIYFHNCKQNKIELIINTNQYEVYQHLEDYYLIDKQNQQLKIITFNQGFINQIELYNNIQIIKVQQIQDKLIINVKNQRFPILISKLSFQYQNQYLSQNLVQAEQILYYQKLGTYQFIQYPNIIAYEFQGEVKCFQFSNLLIIQMKNWLKGLFYIYAVQNQTNSILLYFINSVELHQFQNYTLEEYQFTNPLKYTYNYYRLAILTKQNMSYYIALFSIADRQINLIDIINTDDTYFEILNSSLIYLKNGQIRQRYLNELDALIETNMSVQKELYSQYQLTLKPTLIFKDDINLKFFFSNECYQLFSLKNSISLRLQNNENIYLKISELIQGPINNLTIKSNLKIYLKNPFQSIYQIEYCDEKMLVCIQELKIKKQIETNQILYSFFVIFNEYKSVYSILQENKQEHFNQVFWISDYYFIWFSQFYDGLHIRLLQCTIMDENCKEIQLLVVNFTVEIPFSSNIIKTQNLVKIKNQLDQIYLYISNQNFSLINIPDFNFDIKYVENSENLFIALKSISKDLSINSTVELIIYSINFNNFVEIFSKIITQEIENLIPMNSKFQNIQLISCKQNANVIIINILLKNFRHFFMIKLQINIQNGFIITYYLQKQIRNSLLNYEYKFDYVDEDYIILNWIQYDALLLYNLQEERLFYDYYHLLFFHFQIIRINTTHFIFKNNSNIYLGIIQQYEIDIQNIDNINFNFIIYAQNDISNTQIQINVTREIYLNKNIIIIQLINMIFILLQLRIKQCRNSQKKQQIQQLQIYI